MSLTLTQAKQTDQIILLKQDKSTSTTSISSKISRQLQQVKTENTAATKDRKHCKVINKTVTNSKTTTIFVKKSYISLQLQLKPAKRNSKQQKGDSRSTTSNHFVTKKTTATKEQFDNMKAKSIDSTKLVTIKSPTQQTKQNAVPTLQLETAKKNSEQPCRQR